MIRRLLPMLALWAAALCSAPGLTAQIGEIGGALDQDPAADSKVTISARFDPPKAKAGQEVDIVIDVEVVEGWHLYGSADENGLPTTFVVEDTFGIEPVGEPRIPPGEAHDIGGFTSHWLEGKFELRQRFKVDDEEEEGELAVSGTASFMVCDPLSCLPPDDEEFVATLEIVGADAVIEPAAPKADDADATAGAAPPADDEDRDGSWGELLLLAFGAGLLALAMPCTYPMVPITFSFFTKQADARGGKVLPLALTYGAGIVSIFVLIGIVAAPIVVPFAQHWLTNAVIGVVFVIFAFALFGLINLEPPKALQSLAGQASSKGGYFGVFLMGLCLVVTSFTCTVPFVGTMLSLSAAGGLDQVVVGMGVFGLTMALPFVALALVPGRVASMPRAGEWMNTLKVTLGFVELAAALKFFSNVDLFVHGGIQDAWITRELFAWVWAAIFAATALYLVGVFSRGMTIGLKRRIAGIAFGGIAFYCGALATGREPDYLMTAILPPSKHEARHEVVKEDIAKAFDAAKAHDKLLLLNFTGLT